MEYKFSSVNTCLQLYETLHFLEHSIASARPTTSNPSQSGITYEGSPHLTLGGVGRNLAVALEYLGHKPIFVTAMAHDKLASLALNDLKESGLGLKSGRLKVKWMSESTKVPSSDDRRGLNESNSSNSSSPSSCFALVLMDSIEGQCEYVIANLDATKALTWQAMEDNMEDIKRAPLLVMDANLMDHSIESLVVFCHKHRVPIFVEPTDVMALPNLVRAIERLKRSPKFACLNSLLCFSPNLLELQQMVALLEQTNDTPKLKTSDDDGEDQDNSKLNEAMPLDKVQRLARRLMDNHLPQLRCLLVTMDKRGVLVAFRGKMENVDFAQQDGLECHNLDKIKLMEFSPLRQINHSHPSGLPISSYSSSQKQPSPNHEQTQLYLKHFDTPVPVQRPVSVSGAGDSFAAGFISGLLANLTLDECLDRAFKASLLALNDKDTISSKLKGLTIEWP